MYRLLIVTQSQSVRDLFSSIEGWENMGFKPPHLRQNLTEAIECLHKHCIDAIASDVASEYDELRGYLDKQYPNMLIFSIESDKAKQIAELKDVAGLLNRLYADDSNDVYDLSYLLKQQREQWMKRLMSGLVESQAKLNKDLQLYRFAERADVPCILSKLILPQDDDFITERWHYGGERLETALRNFFGEKHANMLLYVAAVSPEEVRLLCYPKNEAQELSFEKTDCYVRETVEQIQKYIGLQLHVAEVRRVSGLTAFVKDAT